MTAAQAAIERLIEGMKRKGVQVVDLRPKLAPPAAAPITLERAYQTVNLWHSLHRFESDVKEHVDPSQRPASQLPQEYRDGIRMLLGGVAELMAAVGAELEAAEAAIAPVESRR